MPPALATVVTPETLIPAACRAELLATVLDIVAIAWAVVWPLAIAISTGEASPEP